MEETLALSILVVMRVSARETHAQDRYPEGLEIPENTAGPGKNISLFSLSATVSIH
jgi:hypothetical protein